MIMINLRVEPSPGCEIQEICKRLITYCEEVRRMSQKVRNLYRIGPPFARDCFIVAANITRVVEIWKAYKDTDLEPGEIRCVASSQEKNRAVFE